MESKCLASLEDIESFVLETLEENMLIRRGWRFEWNVRIDALGQCKYGHGNKIVHMSRPICKLNLHLRNVIEEVVYHECAHAMQVELRGWTEHNKEWGRICKQMGGSGKATISIEKTGLTLPPGKYTYKCKSCDYTHQAATRIKEFNDVECPYCRGPLKERRHDDRFLEAFYR